MGGKYGTVEFREIVLFFKTVLVRVIQEYKDDGKLNVEDLKDILTDDQIISDLFTALDGSEDAAAEVKEIDFDDALELAKFIYACGVEIVKELR